MMLTTLLMLTLSTEGALDSTQARRFFEEGRAHLKAGRVAAACEAFAGSLHYQRTIGVLLNLASCSEQLKRFPEAWRAADEAVVLATRAHDPRAQLAGTLQLRAERLVAFVTIEVEGVGSSGEVLINGEASPLAEPLTQLVVPLGDTEIVVRAPGRLSFKTKATLASKEVLKLGPWRDPLMSMDDAACYPWFSTQRLSEETRLTVLRVESRFPYFGIPSNGCVGGTTFVTGLLAEAKDGLPALTTVVVRTPSPNEVKPGSTHVFRGLARAGLGPDRTPVFCVAAP
jgi:hypothetical protein